MPHMIVEYSANIEDDIGTESLFAQMCDVGVETGVFARSGIRVALLDRQLMNVGITVFVSVRANRHAADWVDRFRTVVKNTPEIIEAHRLSGDTDYLLRVVVPSIESFDQVYKKMINALEFTDVSSSFSMEELKYTTAIPVSYV